MTQNNVSSLSTGGIGWEFEYRVAAVVLARLLRGAHAPVGFQLPVRRVALQQRNNDCPFDDIVAFGQLNSDGPRMQIQVKHRIEVTGKDPHFIKVMQAAVEVCRHEPEDVRDGSLRMVLAAGGDEGHLAELAELTEWAVSCSRDVQFDPRMRRPFINHSLVQRYSHVLAAVSAAAEIESEAEVAVLTHRILAATRVWHVRPMPDGRDWCNELDGLRELAGQVGRREVELLDHLLVLAQRFGPREGIIDAEQLRGELRSQFAIQLPGESDGAVAPAGSTINISHTGSGAAIGAHSLNITTFNAGA